MTRDPDQLAASPGSKAAPSIAWAKSRDGEPCLSLVDHSVDVAAMAEAILTVPVVRRRLRVLAGRELKAEDIGRLAFFAGLHDLGKVVHPFQKRLRGEAKYGSHIAPAWVLLGSASRPSKLRRKVRRTLTQSRWKAWFADRYAEAACWDAVLAHHGGLPADPAPGNVRDWWPDGSGYDPLAALAEVVAVLRGMFPDAFREVPAPLPEAPRFLHAFAGLVVLADWLGSDQTAFRFPENGRGNPTVLTGADRASWSRSVAADLVRRRWLDPTLARDAANGLRMHFRELFRSQGFRSPRPAQQALLEGPLPRPGQIVVLEAETGSGKTEAALIHFLRLFRSGGVDGMYFALPTRAAAKQIHRRIKRTLKAWLGEQAPPVGLAVPGYLRVDESTGERLPGFEVLWPDRRMRDRGWAVENANRYLSGAVMVGTVDQALLGGLRVRHAQFRSGPMLRLLLVVDEVHASDTYMTTLLRNLLDQHATAGGHALLMSATLGASAREPLLRPGDRIEPPEIPPAAAASTAPYPSLQRAGEPLTALDRDGRSKRVSVELLDPETDSEPLFARLKAAADAGAVVLFIRNRVDDAVEAVRRLEDSGTRLLECAGIVAPHHGRFAPEDRRLLDRALEDAMGRNGRTGLVAVTTQTAEQSLDICADWLVTDIAPGDVLLQRIGRLHRHEENRRPDGFRRPTATLLAPTAERMSRLLTSDGEIRRGRSLLGLGWVYRNVAGVLATRRWLAGRREIAIPDDNRDLVEAATHRRALEEFAAAEGGSWPFHLDSVLVGSSAEATAALSVKIEWEESLAANQPIRNIEATTRLGLADRRVKLREPLPGPFGAPVRTLHFPAWMLPDDLPEDAEPEVIEADRGVLRLRLGERRFVYDRLGLRRGEKGPV